MPHPNLMLPPETALLVVDVQEKLLPKIDGAAALLRNVAFLIDAANLLEVEVLATEQYPKGLGPTVPELASKLASRPDKKTFSCCGVPALVEGLKDRGRSRVVLAGIETHVCVLHTALDLLEAGIRVYVPVDAVGSRYAVDREAALRRLERIGAVPTSTETCAFEWLGTADHPRFKEVSTLVQNRMKDLAQVG